MDSSNITLHIHQIAKSIVNHFIYNWYYVLVIVVIKLIYIVYILMKFYFIFTLFYTANCRNFYLKLFLCFILDVQLFFISISRIFYVHPFARRMMNCFCGMVDQGKVFSLSSSWDHCQWFPPWQSSNLVSGFIFSNVIT